MTLLPDGGEDDTDGENDNFPEVVTLCGSTKFKDEYREENMRLTTEGKIVISVGFFGHAEDVLISDAEKEKLDEIHKRKIDLADRIHVINKDGYIGESTRSEIAYASEHGVDITYMEDGYDYSDIENSNDDST